MTREVRVVILGEVSNTVKEFKGEDAFKQAAIYFANLSGTMLFESTNAPMVNKPRMTARVKVQKVLAPKKIVAKVLPKKEVKSKKK